ADYEVETVLPGALVPALLDDFSTSGKIFAAQDYRK
ncbi:MAG: NAD(P)-dependent oxidoreductase, partial [Desulfuromonas sp.]